MDRYSGTKRWVRDHRSTHSRSANSCSQPAQPDLKDAADTVLGRRYKMMMATKTHHPWVRYGKDHNLSTERLAGAKEDLLAGRLKTSTELMAIIAKSKNQQTSRQSSGPPADQRSRRPFRPARSKEHKSRRDAADRTSSRRRSPSPRRRSDDHSPLPSSPRQSKWNRGSRGATSQHSGNEPPPLTPPSNDPKVKALAGQDKLFKTLPAHTDLMPLPQGVKEEATYQAYSTYAWYMMQREKYEKSMAELTDLGHAASQERTVVLIAEMEELSTCIQSSKEAVLASDPELHLAQAHAELTEMEDELAAMQYHMEEKTAQIKSLEDMLETDKKDLQDMQERYHTSLRNVIRQKHI